MAATVKEGVVQAFEIIKQEEIAAPIEIVFETILEQMGPLNSTPEKPMPMVLEPSRPPELVISSLSLDHQALSNSRNTADEKSDCSPNEDN